MYNENELITIKWTTRNKAYYENKGYKYDKMGNELIIYAKDLPYNSMQKVSVQCDCIDCNNKSIIPFNNYNKSIEKYGIYKCKECAIKDGLISRTEQSHNRLYEIFLQKCKEHNAVPITTRENFGGSKSYVEYICPVHGPTKTLMNNIVGSNAWCYSCGKDSMANYCRLDSDRVKEIVESKNDNILLNPYDYINTTTSNLNVICGNCGDIFTTSLSSIINGGGKCIKCGLEKQIERCNDDKEQYYNYFKQICDENNYILLSPLSDYVNCFSKLKFICPKHGEQEVSYSKFQSGQRCPMCGKEEAYANKRLSQDEVELRINSINGNVLLNKEDYIKNSEINLKIQCFCGNIYTTSLVNYERENVNRCPICSQSESKGEYEIRKILEIYSIQYIPQAKFDDCKDIRALPFDFYLPEYNYIIEFDGPQHFEPIYGEEQLLYIQKHDMIKNAYCKNNNINIIRIPYWDSGKIKEIILNELNLKEIKYIKYPIVK